MLRRGNGFGFVVVSYLFPARSPAQMTLAAHDTSILPLPFLLDTVAGEGCLTCVVSNFHWHCKPHPELHLPLFLILLKATRRLVPPWAFPFP